MDAITFAKGQVEHAFNLAATTAKDMTDEQYNAAPGGTQTRSSARPRRESFGCKSALRERKAKPNQDSSGWPTKCGSAM